MPIQRTLYSTQKLDLYLDGDAATAIVGLPVQSASIDRTVPTENILTLGRLGALGRQQKTYETVKMSVKLFWTSGDGVNGANAAHLTAGDLSTLTGYAVSGTRSKLVLSPQGFTGYGILSNFSIDSSVGDFVSATLAFDGFGSPNIAKNVNSATSNPNFEATSVNVWTSANVKLNDAATITLSSPATETIKSAKFSIDLPNETLGTLGSAISGNQDDANFTGHYLQAAKPPFKLSINYDGQTITGASGHAASTLTFGHLKIKPTGFNLTSQKFDQKAGDIGATVSFSSEGTTCQFEAVT